MKPILKWPGGKTQLLDVIESRMPKQYNRYYEPFLGGGSVLFHFTPERASVSDTNRQLVNLYRQIKRSPDAVFDLIDRLDAEPCNKQIYYENRGRYNEKIAADELDPECAALMVWVNKHCFNGLYRVNSKGQFNAAYNNRVGGSSIDKANATEISDYLNYSDVTISCMDFEEACEDVQPGDFVYFDSPYVPESATANFTEYTSGGFTMANHKRLYDLFCRLDRLGVKLMLSNSNVPYIHKLYGDGGGTTFRSWM